MKTNVTATVRSLLILEYVATFRRAKVCSDGSAKSSTSILQYAYFLVFEFTSTNSPEDTVISQNEYSRTTSK